MANEVAWRYSTPSLTTLYFTIRGGAGANLNKMWNTSGTPAFETLTVANWANYKIAMSEITSAGYLYAGTFPAVSGNMVAGWYWVDVFSGSGAISDLLVATLLGYWDGTYFKPQADDAVAIGGTVQTPTDVGAGIISGTVAAVTSTSQFTCTSSAMSTNSNDYNNMWIVFTSGANAGIPRIIGTYTGSTKQVQMAVSGTTMTSAFPHTISPGDAFLILAGAE